MRTQHENLMKKKNCRLCGRDLTEIFGRHAKKRYCPVCSKLAIEIGVFLGGIFLSLASFALAVITQNQKWLIGMVVLIPSLIAASKIEGALTWSRS